MNRLLQIRLDALVKTIATNRRVAAIYLFGSQATGRARGDSDIDIAVMLKKPTLADERFVHRLWSDVFDVRCFHTLPLLLQFRVFKEGRALYIKDKKFLHLLKVYTLGHYLDFSSFIKDFYRKALKYV